MRIVNLDKFKPIYNIKFIENQERFVVGQESIVLNLGENNLQIKNTELSFFKSTIVKNLELVDIQRVLVVDDYTRFMNGQDRYKSATTKWQLMFDITQLSRFEGKPIRRSLKEVVGNFEFYLFSADASTNIGIHKQHDHLEVHTQLFGYGKMQKFESTDYNTLYEEVILAPGATHPPFYDDEGRYPWHQYQSITNSIYIYVILNKTG